MKKADFECCNIDYYVESDTVKEYYCRKCNKKFKLVKGVWK